MHPAIGAAAGQLLAAAGCSILDRRALLVHNLVPSLDRAVASGKVSRPEADRWLAEQHRHATTGRFRAEIARILWVAATPR